MVLLASFGHTGSLMSIRLPPSVRDRTESVIADFAASHPANSAHRTLGGPYLQYKHQLTIPLNRIHTHILGMDPDVFFTPVVWGCMCSS
ncbi:hypothetical protein HOY80DRAFT_941421 [Tuber brumale]|nr:hypothetical protein HOY80DRAFT_941421 [Tuber brumale]